MIVIADTGPLRYLILIEEVRLLPILYGRIVVPRGVVTELSHNETPERVRAWMTQPPDWLEVRSVRDPTGVFPLSLGSGEREAIALAEELKADVLLADDGAARDEARKRHITVQGTLGLLDLAAEHGYIDMAAALQKLSFTNFRASAKLLNFFLDRDWKRKMKPRS